MIRHTNLQTVKSKTSLNIMVQKHGFRLSCKSAPSYPVSMVRARNLRGSRPAVFAAIWEGWCANPT